MVCRVSVLCWDQSVSGPGKFQSPNKKKQQAFPPRWEESACCFSTYACLVVTDPYTVRWMECVVCVGVCVCVCAVLGLVGLKIK